MDFPTTSIIFDAETLQTILNAIPSPTFLIDRAHRLVLVNDAFCAMAGQPREQILNNTNYPMPEAQKQILIGIDDEVFATGQPNENEEVVTMSPGNPRILLTRKCLVKLPTTEGEQAFILASTTDVTQFREAQSKAQFLAEHDSLTGLANRSHFNANLAHAIDVADKEGKSLALLVIDLDKFKAVNDEYGHPAGDAVLRVVAKRLTGLVRRADTVARLGGDEFCIILNTVADPSAAFALSERILSSLSQPVVVDELHLFISASIGIALFPADGDSPDTLIQGADKALYQVKQNGRCGYLRYQAETNARPPGP